MLSKKIGYIFLITFFIFGLLSEGKPAFSGEGLSKELKEKIKTLKSSKTKRMIVLFDDQFAIIPAKRLGKFIKRFKYINGFVLEIPEDKIKLLKKIKGIKKVEEDALIYALPIEVASDDDIKVKDKVKSKTLLSGTQDSYVPLSAPDPNYLRWNHKEEGINAVNAWNTHSVDGAGVTVAVLDTGVNYNLPDLATTYDGLGNPSGGYLGGQSFVPMGAPHEGDTDPIDNGVLDYPEAEGDHTYNSWVVGHGTGVTSVLCSKGEDTYTNGQGQTFKVIGIAYKTGYYALKVLRSGRPGEPTNIPEGTGYVSWAIDALEWCLDPAHKPDIINMSFGIYTLDDTFGELTAYRIACQNAYDLGIILVGASGNEGGANPVYPARFDSVISVGALSYYQNVASYSSGGVDFVAPGGTNPYDAEDFIRVWGVCKKTFRDTGTSYAAPHVSGLMALQLQFSRNIYP